MGRIDSSSVLPRESIQFHVRVKFKSRPQYPLQGPTCHASRFRIQLVYSKYTSRPRRLFDGHAKRKGQSSCGNFRLSRTPDGIYERGEVSAREQYVDFDWPFWFDQVFFVRDLFLAIYLFGSSVQQQWRSFRMYLARTVPSIHFMRLPRFGQSAT